MGGGGGGGCCIRLVAFFGRLSGDRLAKKGLVFDVPALLCWNEGREREGRSRDCFFFFLSRFLSFGTRCVTFFERSAI